MTKNTKSEYTCVHKVWSHFQYYRCGKPADAQGFCKWHRPETIAKRRATINSKAQARYDAKKKEWADEKVKRLHAEHYPRLVAELKRIRNVVGEEDFEIIGSLLREIGEET